jgi:beta-lactamase class A
MAALREELLAYLNTRGIINNGTGSVVSIYVRDLASGAEMGLYERVPHSAASTAKIGVMANYFRYVYQEPAVETKFELQAAIICSSNSNANQLMEITGEGDPLAGIRRTQETFCRAGAVNTLIDRRFWIGEAGEGGVPADHYDPAGSAVCPASANSPPDTSLTVNVDPLLQTTAADMGHLLSEIYACAQEGRGQAETFPNEITQTECRWMLELLRGARFMHLLELGVPEGVTIAHKVGYGGEAVGDAGLVFSPGGDYVLVVYLWDRRLANFDAYALSRWAAIGEVSRLVYNTFNPDAPLEALRQPPNPNGGVACVLPTDVRLVSLDDSDAGRFDAEGNPLASACYDWPICRTFEGWGQ